MDDDDISEGRVIGIGFIVGYGLRELRELAAHLGIHSDVAAESQLKVCSRAQHDGVAESCDGGRGVAPVAWWRSERTRVGQSRGKSGVEDCVFLGSCRRLG